MAYYIVRSARPLSSSQKKTDTIVCVGTPDFPNGVPLI